MAITPNDKKKVRVVHIQLSTNEVADELMKVEAFGDSFAACLAMAEYLEYIEDCNCAPMQLDAIAIRCEFSLDTLNGFAADYSDSLNGDGVIVSPKGTNIPDREAVIEWFSERTVFIEVEFNLFIKGEC